MKASKLITIFLTALIINILVIAFSIFQYKNETTNILHENKKTFFATSSTLIADKVYDDLLINNFLEVDRKLNLLIERSILKKFHYSRNTILSSEHFDSCEKIYFDKVAKKSLWGQICFQFESKYLKDKNINIERISYIFIFLLVFIILTIILFFKLISLKNLELKRHTQNIIQGEIEHTKNTFWAPILSEIETMVRKKNEAETQIYDQKFILEKNKIATQLAHDIRSPLASLDAILNGINLEEKDFKILKRSTQRIHEIANSLLQQDRVQTPKMEDFNQALLEVIEDKKLEYKFNLNLNLKIDGKAYINLSDFKRIVSNILNNSIEASLPHSVINFSTILANGKLVLEIKDNGLGIPDTILNRLGKEEVTTKLSGNGIGYKHSLEKIQSWGGDLKIIETNSSGTRLHIILKFEPANESISINSQFILVDDDELTRMTWEMRAKKSGINFRSFKDARTLRSSLASISKDTYLYIDSELGETKGEELAVELHNLGYSNISIATGHQAENFKQYKFLKSVISKKAPF